MAFREVKLPSGAVLKISVSPFADSKALYQALLEEAKGLTISSKSDIACLFKDIFCLGFSSKKIEECLWVCFSRCIYNNGRGDLKIDKDTFEPVESRQDYMTVCVEVTKENVLPFAKNLMQVYSQVLAMTENIPA